MITPKDRDAIVEWIYRNKVNGVIGSGHAKKFADYIDSLVSEDNNISLHDNKINVSEDEGEKYKHGFWAGQHSVILPSTKRQIAKRLYWEYRQDYAKQVQTFEYWLDKKEEQCITKEK